MYYYRLKKHYFFNLFIGFATWVSQGVNLPFSTELDNSSNFFILIFILLPFSFAWPIMSYLCDFFTKILRVDAIEDYRIGYRVFIFKVFLFVHAIFLLQGSFCYWECLNITEYINVRFKVGVIVTIGYVLFTGLAKKMIFIMLKEIPLKKAFLSFLEQVKSQFLFNLRILF